MTTQTVTLDLPGTLYHQLKQRAERSHRTVEDELLELLAAAVPAADELPVDLTEALSPLQVLDDETLWRAARSHFAAEAASQLETLHLKQQRDGLSEAEDQTRTVLVRQYERAMLVRAQAAALLKQRGYDVAELIARP
jgi:plasmid stability protein